MSRFLYASFVSDDVDKSVDVLERLGMHRLWRDRHPFFGTDAVLCGTQNGGVMVLGLDGGSAHPAVARYAGARERMFHIAFGDLADDWAAAAGVKSVSEPYDGPAGRMSAAELQLPNGDVLWAEVAEWDAEVSAAGSPIRRIESTPFVASSLAALEAPFESLGFERAEHLTDCHFPTLGCASHIMLVGDSHYLELNEPSAKGVVSRWHDSLGGAGIFGLNVEPVDLDAFKRAADEAGITTNPEEPYPLPVTINGDDITAADILTVPATETGGARLFMLTPYYPWTRL